MVEYKKTSYFVGFWFVAGTDKDWFACVYREQGETNWRLVHRFRYHNAASANPFDGKDKKNFYQASADGTNKDEQQIIADMNKLAGVIAQGFDAKVEFVPVAGDGERAMFRLAMQPWAHVQHGKLPQSPRGEK